MLAPLWITHAGACCGFPSPAGSGAYIRASPCGLRTLGRAVDYDASHLWIRGLGRCGGWLRPHAPQAGLSPARFASCGCSFGAHKVARIRGA